MSGLFPVSNIDLTIFNIFCTAIKKILKEKYKNIIKGTYKKRCSLYKKTI
jgi:hypothetical protein